MKRFIRACALLAFSSSACVDGDLPARPSELTDGGDAADGEPDTAGRLNVDLVWKGAGCGKPLPRDHAIAVPGTPTGWVRYQVSPSGATLANTIMDGSRIFNRTFWVRVPVGYRPDEAHRVVYLGQGCGDGGGATTHTYPLYDAAKGGTEDAIYVALDVDEPREAPTCYDDRSYLYSQEWESFELIHGVVDSTYCVDDNRVFVAGYDSGATLANMWGCYFGSQPAEGRKFARRFRIRGQAGVAGTEPFAQPECAGPVAALWIHDVDLPPEKVLEDLEARDRVLKSNHCVGSPTVPWPAMPERCVQYTDCPRSFPVIFCETSGRGSDRQDDLAIPAFTKFFQMTDPAPR